MSSSQVLLDVFSITQNKIVWENTRPGSVINCRPIKLEHVQESYEGTREHFNKIQDQIDKINETAVNIDETTIINIKKINFSSLFLTKRS
jgi:hypothetical protein